MRYICLILSIICLAYYILCVSYAGRKSSFIWIWLLGTIFFAGLYIAGTLDAKGIIDIPQLVKNIARVVIITGFVIFAILESLIVISMKQKPDYNCEYVIVLGCQVRRDGPSLMLRRRLDAACSYLSADTKADCIVSGGKGDNEHISEAEAMYEALVNDGISENRITKEDKSSSTYENLLFSKQILEDSGKPLRIAIVTDGFHQWRARLQAESFGYDVKCVSAATPWYLVPVYWVREWFALSYLFVFGA